MNMQVCNVLHHFLLRAFPEQYESRAEETRGVLSRGLPDTSQTSEHIAICLSSVLPHAYCLMLKDDLCLTSLHPSSDAGEVPAGAENEQQEEVDSVEVSPPAAISENVPAQVGTHSATVQCRKQCIILPQGRAHEEEESLLRGRDHKEGVGPMRKVASRCSVRQGPG